MVVLVNDDSIYVYEIDRLKDKNNNNGNDDDAGSDFPIQLTKHIHPIEQRDLHGRYLKNHRTNDLNNSKYKMIWIQCNKRHSALLFSLFFFSRFGSLLFLNWTMLITVENHCAL